VPIAKNGYSKENLQLSRGGEVGLISRMGAYEESRRKLRAERSREYNEFLAKVSVCCMFSKFNTAFFVVYTYKQLNFMYKILGSGHQVQTGLN